VQKPTKTTYVLIDYENVQPKDVSLLVGETFQVKVFIGANQAKIPTSLVRALHPLGNKLEYIQLDTAGSNALDFHIAYYLGDLCARDRSAMFQIISKDSGFDPLIRHLKKKGILVGRSDTIADVTGSKVARAPEDEQRARLAIAHLIGLKSARPKKMTTLRSTLHALYQGKLSEAALAALVDALSKQGIVQTDGTKVSYSFPTPGVVPNVTP
jgi:PIN domain